MAQYDGSIRINTKIDSKQASAQLMTLENRIAKTADKIAGLRSKMDALKDAKIPTQEYSEISMQIQKAESEFNKFLEKQEQMQREGKDNGVAWERLNEKMEEIGNTIRYAQGELQDLIDTGKAFTIGSDTEEFSKLGQQLQYVENDMAVLNQRHDELIAKQEKASGGYRKLGDVAKKSFNSVGNVLKKANSHVNAFGKRLKEIAHRILPTFHKEAKRTNTMLGQFSTRLKSLLSGMFIFNVISSYIRKMFSGVNEGFENFYNQNAAFKSSVDSMRTSLLQLKNTFAAAFAPIVSVAIPYLEKLISYITKAVNSIGQLISALLGKKTYTKAIRVNVENLEDTSDALEEVKEEAEEAEKALDGYLSPLDEINKYSEDKEIKVDIDTGKKPDASDIGDNIVDMFEEVPIDSYFLDLADKMKDIFSQLFAPLKEAWKREGKFVMDSWKYALKEVGDLIKSIGSDFLEVWQQEKTIKIFEDLLHIVGDIGLVVGNLAHNFRMAWEENETGKRILEGIRDIIGVIVSNIRHAADATVEWSKNLNFSPLLTAIKGWIESLVPVFDNLSGIITDFYEKVLLPLGKWTLEKGLPELLQVFIDFNNKVDWEALRNRLAQFWEHLEPFAETVGEGLIIFIEQCANALADFINSPAFDNFLTMIENWMDNVSPKDVADALEAIGKAIVYLKGAVFGFSIVSKGITMLSKLFDVLKLFDAGGGISSALGGLKNIGATIAGWAPHIAVGVGIVDVIKRIKEAVSERIDTSGFGIADWISETLKLALEGWKQEFENWKISLELWWQDTWISNAIWNFGQWWEEKVKPWFAKERWQELWSNITESLSAKWQDVVNSWNKTKEKLTEKWNEIKDNANSNFDDIKKTLSDSWKNIKETTAQVWQDIGKNLSEKWGNLKSGAKSAFDGIKNGIKESWTNIKSNVKESANNIKENISSAWEKAKENTYSAWSSIKEKAVSSAQSMAGGVRDKFSGMQSAVSNFSSSAQSIWSRAWEGMQGKVGSVLDSVKNTISSVFGWISRTIGSLGNSLRNLTSRVISSRSTSFYSYGRNYSFAPASAPVYQSSAFDSLKNVPIPKLATGAVIPANKEFLAVLGDQKHGTNIEAPLETIKQAQVESLLEVFSRLGLTGSSAGSDIAPIILKLFMDSKIVYEAMIKEGKVRQMSTGSNDFMLGTT